MSTREPPPRRKPRPRTVEGGRRLQSAGATFVVCLAGLGIALLLNAPGLHKSATTQPEGWKRDVALAATGTLESVSGALFLDQPRKGLKAALGRSGEDEIDTVVVVPRQKPTPGSTPTTPPKRERFGPSKKLRLWVAGDSLVVIPGQSILREVAGNPAFDTTDAIDGRLSTGLERPDVFNWFAHIRDVMEAKKPPRAVVVMFGGNDDHGFMTGIPEGREVGTFGSPTWRAEYRRRVATVMDTIIRNGGLVVWIGLPISRDSDQTLRFDVINAIAQTEAAKRKGRAAYLDTYFFFAGEDGGYAQYIEDASGKLVKMRADDGVHFERAAGDLIAAKVVDLLEERYDITSWRTP